MIQTLIEGFLLGISTGTVCLATCAPIYIPYMLNENKKISGNLALILEISAGRFFTYLAFGAIAGLIGKAVTEIDKSIYTYYSYILLSAFLVFSVFRTHKEHKHCPTSRYLKMTKSGFLLGVITGISFCPSFLIALAKAVNLAGVMSGIVLFLGFFVGTTLFLLPLVVTSFITRMVDLKLWAKIASILVAIWFTYLGIVGIVQWHKANKTEHVHVETRIVDAFKPDHKLVIVYKNVNAAYFKAINDSVKSLNLVKTEMLPTDTLDYQALLKYKNQVIFFDRTYFDYGMPDSARISYDSFAIEPGYEISGLKKYLSNFTFQVEKNKYLIWELK